MEAGTPVRLPGGELGHVLGLAGDGSGAVRVQTAPNDVRIVPVSDLEQLDLADAFAAVAEHPQAFAALEEHPQAQHDAAAALPVASAFQLFATAFRRAHGQDQQLLREHAAPPLQDPQASIVDSAIATSAGAEDEESLCVYCQETLAGSALVRYCPCEHVFHAACHLEDIRLRGNEAAIVQARCPLCRRSVEDVVPVDDDGGAFDARLAAAALLNHFA
jgi:hypothetical protein